MPASPQQQPSNQYHSVHASAGSGKTYHLVSHMVRLLILGAEPASILAITFTRKAASEMQERLLERVFELAIASDDELDVLLKKSFDLVANDAHRSRAKSLYESLLHANQGVRTTTFHAFCQDLLRRFPMEADIPPGFELVERTGYLIDEAWNNLENEFTRNASQPVVKHFDTLLTRLGTTETRSMLNKFIAARSEWWALASQTKFDIEQHCEDLAKKLGVTSDVDPVHHFFNNEENLENLREYLRLLPLAKVRDHEQCARAIDQALIDQDESECQLVNVWSAFFTGKDKPRSRKESAALKKRLGEADCETFFNLHESLCDKLINLRQQIHAMETLSLTRAWLHAGKAFIDRYQKIKQNHRNLDFSDLEWQCYCLLNSSDHADWIQYKLDQRIDHLLIDEFQDTNQTQWQLILPLLRELAAAQQERQRSVLFVGDSKQSIYRFRRAEPKLFDAASHWIETNLGADKQYLSRSYRSSPAVIDFVNRLFDGNELIQLNDFQTHETVKTTLAGAVELLPLSIQEGKKNNQPGEFRNPLTTPLAVTDSVYLIEAQVAAEKISTIIDSKLIIGEADAAHYVDYGDIMILLRNRTHAADYELALRAAHIPYMGTERGTLLESLEIQDMVNLLQWLITPFDNHALAGVLRSPLFSATEQDLYPLVDHKNWFERIIEQHATATESTDANPADESPLARAAFHLQNWIALTDFLPVHDLLDRIYSEGNLLERYKANYPEHLQSRVQANLTRFIELALENDSGRYPSLTRFLAWLRLLKQQDQEAPDQPASDSDRNRVRILTIHESKGLESPVVLLLDATTTKRNRGGASVLIDWPLNHDDDKTEESTHPTDFLVSPSAPYPNAHCEKLINEQAEKETQEEANLLYVAVTRAQQYLYISGSGKPTGWYGHICQQYELSDEALLTDQTLAAHKGEVKKPTEKIMTAAKEIQPETRLQKPIPLATNQVDIAPSKNTHNGINTHGNRDANQAVKKRTPSSNDYNENDLNARERGILIHQMIEALSIKQNLSLDDFCKTNHYYKQLEYLTTYWQQAVQTIEHFPEYFQEHHYQTAYSEVPVCYKKGDTIVNGIIDRLVVNTDEIIVIDYKTHEIENDKNLDKIAREFHSQLSFYRDGVALLYPGRAIKTCLIFTSLPACLEVNLD